MSPETKVLLVSIYKYISEIDDEGAKAKMLEYIKLLANVDGIALELPKDETNS